MLKFNIRLEILVDVTYALDKRFIICQTRLLQSINIAFDTLHILIDLNVVIYQAVIVVYTVG